MLRQDAIDEERMDVAQRKRYSAEFKARVALEALKGQKTVNELASTYGVHPTQVAHWKHRLHKERPDIVSARRVKREDEPEALQAQMYQQIGQPEGRIGLVEKADLVLCHVETIG
jgi:transposase-like protein